MEDKAVREEATDPLLELSRTALQAYLLLLRTRRPIGVRELQRALGLRSPSTARHHLERLMALGLVEQKGNGYIAKPPRKGLLKAYIMIRGRLVPKNLALTTFLATATILYTILPGRDPVAATILATATLISIHDTIEAMKALKTLEKTTEK